MAQFFPEYGIRKILIIRFSSIGDIVLTTPLIRCLRQQSGCEIHFLTKRKFTLLLEANPNLDRVFSFEKKLSEIIPVLKKERYDAIIDLHKNLRSFRVRCSLGVRSFSFDKINVQKWLFVNLKVNRLPQVHVVDRYLAAVAQLGIKNDGLGLDYFIKDEGGEEFVHSEIGKFRSNLPYVVFAIGAAHQTKRLPAEQIIALCQQVKKPVILLGGQAEEAEGAYIAKMSGKHVTNACGKLNLDESAFVIKAAEKVITHDTGMMHIAAAFQREILSVWGSTVPAFGMYPYYGNNVDKNTSFEVDNLPCRPCSKIGFDQCPKGHFHCMTKHNLAAIAAKANGETA